MGLLEIDLQLELLQRQLHFLASDEDTVLLGVEHTSRQLAAQLDRQRPGVAAQIYPLSVLNQAALFFYYGFLWLVPVVGWMSIDMRPPFPLGFDSLPHLAGAAAYLLLLLAASAAQAHDIRQHAPHVHGQATVDVALDQQTLEFALQAPGIGILDYERPPANAAEQAALARATTVLKGGSWVTLPTAAGCRLATGKADAEGFDATATDLLDFLTPYALKDAA